ncbi:polymorphic outer membrane protein, partial [Chlamydia psittaci 08-2626_L3]
GGGGCSRSC